MQKMNKYNAKIDVIQSDNVYNKGKSITEKSEILHLKEIVKGTYKNNNYTPHITTLVPIPHPILPHWYRTRVKSGFEA